MLASEMVGGQDGSQRRHGSEDELELGPGAVAGEGLVCNRRSLAGLPGRSGMLTSGPSPGGRGSSGIGTGMVNISVQNCVSVLLDGR